MLNLLKIPAICLIASILIIAPANAGYQAIGSCRCSCPETNFDVLEVRNNSLYNKLKGKIIIRSEGNGEVYYIGLDKKIYYLGNKENFYSNLKTLSYGITSSDIKKIKAGILKMNERDTDKDGLSDQFETAIGTDPTNFNTDGDRYSDFTEITNGYNPNGKGKLPISKYVTGRMQGRILTQVDNHSYHWYINPGNGRRYFLNSNLDALEIVKKLGIGISEYNFYTLTK